jgi:hypothetical protein
LIISEAQAKKLEQNLQAALDDPDAVDGPIGHSPDRRIEPIRGEYRSSIIVDPPTGTYPGTPLFDAWQAKTRFNTLNAADGPEQRPNSERCLGHPNAQPPIVALHSYPHQIVQTADSVLMVSELLHQARVIRLNSAHGPSTVTSWLGDSIGQWEGDTLVVETKYFTPSDTGRIGPRINFRVSPNTVVTERFTRVSVDQLDYSFTVVDPLFYTQPWTGESHFMRSHEPMFEDSCHEGNRSLVYVLQGARVKEGSWPPNESKVQNRE